MMNQLSLLILTWLYLVHQNCAQNPSNEENKIGINLNINIDPSQKGINNSTNGKRSRNMIIVGHYSSILLSGLIHLN